MTTTTTLTFGIISFALAAASCTSDKGADAATGGAGGVTQWDWGTGGGDASASGGAPGSGGQATGGASGAAVGGQGGAGQGGALGGAGGVDASVDAAVADGSADASDSADAGAVDAAVADVHVPIPRPPGPAGTVTFYLTNTDGSAKFSPQPTLMFAAPAGNADPTITIDTATTYQTIDGFGLSLTNGSCEVLRSLPETTQDAILKDLFDPVDGIGISLTRISIGASDLNSTLYFYDNTAGDVDMKDFSLDGPDMTYTIPILKKVLAIYPELKILGSPWSPPPWMKTNNSTVGGSLLPQYYAAYALYFRKYLEAMRAQGIDLWAITVQNEPLHDGNNPSMSMSADEQVAFINNNLGPTLRGAGLTTKILAYDHNCDVASYAVTVCQQASEYVAGSAFHLYGGSISALTTTHDTTGKDVWLTEQATLAGMTLQSYFLWHMQNIELGTVNNWGRGSIEWNLASYTDFTPHTPGGCSNCQGAILVEGANAAKALSYWIVAHMSKFIRPGAVRVASSSGDATLMNAAFTNDGVMTIVVLNTDAVAKTFNIAYDGSEISATLQSHSAGTFTWDTRAN